MADIDGPGGDGVGRPHEVGQVRTAAELRHEPPARFDDVVQGGEQALMVVDPVKRRRREDHVERRLVGEGTVNLEQVRLDERDPPIEIRQGSARFGEHRRRQVGADNPPVGSRSSSWAVTLPEPQPASSTSSSPRSGSRSSTLAPQPACGCATRW